METGESLSLECLLEVIEYFLIYITSKCVNSKKVFNIVQLYNAFWIV